MKLLTKCDAYQNLDARDDLFASFHVCSSCAIGFPESHNLLYTANSAVSRFITKNLSMTVFLLHRFSLIGTVQYVRFTEESERSLLVEPQQKMEI